MQNGQDACVFIITSLLSSGLGLQVSPKLVLCRCLRLALNAEE